MANSATDALLLMAASHRDAYRLIHESRYKPRPPAEGNREAEFKRTVYERKVSDSVKKIKTEKSSTRPVADTRNSTGVTQKKLKLPYNGELGPQTYKDWQIADYFIIRLLVDEIVDDILSCLDTPVDKPPAVIPVIDKQPRPDVSAASESHVAPLIAELMFEVTSKMADAVKQPVASVSNDVNKHFAQLVQKAADKIDEKTPGGHDTSDGVSFAGDAIAEHQKERAQQGNEAWAHTSHFPTNFEPQNNADSDFKDQSTILDFNDVTAVGQHSVNEQQQEAQKMNEYKKQEAETFS